MDKKEYVDKLLKDKPYLKCNLAYKRDINYIKEVLEMPEWEEEKFKPLLTTSIWQSNIKEIKKILQLEAWKNKKFFPLLTSSIWNSNSENIKKVVELKEWEEEKFKPLLTSNIWNSNYQDIKQILNMEQWNDPSLIHLLIPSIFSLNLKNMEQSINLLNEYGIDNKYIKNRCLRRKVKEQKILLDYLVSQKVDLVILNTKGELQLNPLLSYSNTELRKKYNIDIKKLGGDKSHGRVIK